MAAVTLGALLAACETAPREAETSPEQPAETEETESETVSTEDDDSGEAPAEPTKAVATASLLGEYNELGTLSAEARRRTSERLRGSLEPDSCSPQRLKLVMLAVQDPDRGADASQLLAPCLEGDTTRGAATQTGLAQVLADLLANREARHEAEQRQSELARQRQALKRRNRDLKEQIEGLKNIERSLQRRDN